MPYIHGEYYSSDSESDIYYDYEAEEPDINAYRFFRTSARTISAEAQRLSHLQAEMYKANRAMQRAVARALEEVEDARIRKEMQEDLERKRKERALQRVKEKAENA